MAGHVLCVRVLSTKLGAGVKVAGNRDENISFDNRCYYSRVKFGEFTIVDRKLGQRPLHQNCQTDVSKEKYYKTQRE